MVSDVEIKRQPVELAVEIFLDAHKTKSLLKEHMVELKGQIKAELKEMVEELEIPAGIKLGLSKKKDQDQPLVLLINGVFCRMPFDYFSLPELSFPWLKSQIIKEIHVHRIHLLTPDMAQNIRELWSLAENQRYLPGLSRREFFRYLQLLVQHGFKINRGDHLNQLGIPFNYLHTFEKTINEVNNILLILYIPMENITSKWKSITTRFRETCSLMQDGLFYELGVKIPKVRIQEDAALGKKEYRIQINDLRFPVIEGLEANEFLVNASIGELALLQIHGKQTINPANNQDSSIVTETGGLEKVCEDAGYTTWDPIGYVVLSMSASIRKHAGYFLTMEGMEFELGFLNRICPDLFNGIQQRFQTHFLIRVLRELVKEEFSIRDLKGIMEILLAVKTIIKAEFKDKIIFVPYQFNPIYSNEDISLEKASPAQYAETVRVRQKKYISHKLSKGQGTLRVYLLDPAIEKMILASIQAPLAEQEKQKIHKAIAEEVREGQRHPSYPIILTTIEIRRILQEFIRFEFPHLVVISYMELSPETVINPIARISLGNGIEVHR